MRNLMYILTALAVFGLAFWAYRENYATQTVLKQTQRLQRDIGAAQIRLGVLRAEWAYLSRPDRLIELAELNFDRLGLLPLRPDQFSRIDEVSFPPPPEVGESLELPVVNPIDISTMTMLDSGENP